MFIPRSLSRIRRARLAFLAAGLAPTVAVVAWAVHRQSDAHRAAVERRWQEAVGLPLTVGRVEHPRPGVMRASDCILPAAGGRPAVSLPRIEIESSADEDRIRIDRVVGDVATVEAAVSLARRWIAEEVRFRRTCLVEVADFAWPQAATSLADPPATLRIECVPRRDARAIRIVRKAGATDEVRVVRQAAEPDGSPPRYEIEATVSEPVPLAAVMLAAGAGQPERLATGPEPTLVGRLRAAASETGWAGEAAGRIEGLDLAAAASGIGDRAAGSATIAVSRLAWADGRVSDALVEATVGSGWLERRLFDRIVLALSARPGSAAAGGPASDVLGFDSAACIIAVGPHGVQVLPAARSPGGLATLRGEPLLLPPSAPVTADRVAWLFSSPGIVYGPTAGPGAWLMSVLPSPLPQPAAADDGRRF
jgi:hypothetical protein